jgi:hypothetical protein
MFPKNQLVCVAAVALSNVAKAKMEDDAITDMLHLAFFTYIRNLFYNEEVFLTYVFDNDKNDELVSNPCAILKDIHTFPRVPQRIWDALFTMVLHVTLGPEEVKTRYNITIPLVRDIIEQTMDLHGKEFDASWTYAPHGYVAPTLMTTPTPVPMGGLALNASAAAIHIKQDALGDEGRYIKSACATKLDNADNIVEVVHVFEDAVTYMLGYIRNARDMYLACYNHVVEGGSKV